MKLNEKKEEIKLKISTIFTKIRNIINEREDQLLLDVDNEYNNTFIYELQENKILNLINFENEINNILIYLLKNNENPFNITQYIQNRSYLTKNGNRIVLSYIFLDHLNSL